MEKLKRPILRYFGGKWRIAPRLIALMPPHRTYVEPFCGAASVLLRKPPSQREIISDSDPNVIRYLREIQMNGQNLAERIRKTKMTESRWRRSLGSRLPLESVLPLEMAVRSFHSHGADGLWRNGGYRGHPIALAAWKTLPDAILAAQERLRMVEIYEYDVFDTIRRDDAADTLFYLDPPYPKSVRSSSHGYAYEFRELDHCHLAGLLHGIVGKAMVSGYDCPLYARLYADWRKVEIPAMKDSAKRAVECVWMN